MNVIIDSVRHYMYGYRRQFNNKLGEWRTLWGEHEKADFVLATKERMRYQQLLSVSEVTVVVVVVEVGIWGL